MTSDKFLEKARNIFGYKYKYPSLNNKITLKDYIDIIFDDKIYIQKVNKHLLGSCPEKNTPKKTTQEFINESKNIWNDRFDYSLTEYVNSNTKIKVIDTKNGKILEQLPNNHLYGHIANTITSEEFINESKLISNNLYYYDKCEFKNKTNKVILICPYHGEFKVMPHLHLSGYVCPNCDETIASKKIIKFLKKYNIIYLRQHKFEKLIFDFYIPSIRTCIEFDQKIMVNDKIKEDYCEDHFISLIRIKYNQIDEISNILYTNLKNHIKITSSLR
jgi:very-short-patch-repair endonuclease